MDLKQEIEAAFPEKAKNAGLIYDFLDVEVKGADVVIAVGKIIGGVLVKSGLHSGGRITQPRTAQQLVDLTVDRQAQFWTRIQQEYDEDRALMGGAAPTLNPLHRITEPGHYTRGPWAEPARDPA